MFKVAMLRNVALTAPYFHDGAVKTLEEAVKIMADINLGKQLTDDQLKSIVAFLKALTDPKLEKKTALK
jgi:cytochrome c peroxidase